jgi:hypothetical protein
LSIIQHQQRKSIDDEKSLGETFYDKDKNDIEVYKEIKIITIKDGIGYLVMYTAPKL